MSEYERPDDLLRRLKIGREEAMQRLITSLIVGGRYPRWNQRSRATAEGSRFLRALYSRSFGTDWPGDDFEFVDEFELRARHDAEKGGAPDWAAVWPDRLWLIELKSERASHRADQIPGYFVLGRHHHPQNSIDITYLTPTMSADLVPANPWERYAHVSWDEAVSMLREAWPVGDDDARKALVDGAVHAIEHLHLRPGEWRELVIGSPVSIAAPPPAVVEATAVAEVSTAGPENEDDLAGDVIARAMQLAVATGEDGKQRALDVRFDSLDSLLELRIRLRSMIAASPTGTTLRHVLPWIWRPESTGGPLTEAGRSTGYELRFSKYAKPQY